MTCVPQDERRKDALRSFPLSWHDVAISSLSAHRAMFGQTMMMIIDVAMAASHLVSKLAPACLSI